MYCLNCGRQLSDGEEFCTSCGAKVGTAKLPVEQVRNAQPVPNAYLPAQKPKSKMPIVVIIVALIVIAVSAGILTAVLMGGNNGSSSSQNAATSSAATTTVSGTSTASRATASSASASAASEGVAAESTSASASNAGTDASASSPSSSVAADAGEAAAPAQVAEPEPEPVAAPEAQAQGQPGVDAPFWGVWIGAFTHADLAQDMAVDARNKGLPATVLVTTDWSNLNEDFYYVVTIGTSTDESTARRLCAQAIDAGFDGAYVKYSGERR